MVMQNKTGPKAGVNLWGHYTRGLTGLWLHARFKKPWGMQREITIAVKTNKLAISARFHL